MADEILLGDALSRKLDWFPPEPGPNRRELTRLLHVTLMPVCEAFAKEAEDAISSGEILGRLPEGLSLAQGASKVSGFDVGRWGAASGSIIHPIRGPLFAKSSKLVLPVGDYGGDFAVTLWFATAYVVKCWWDYVKSHGDFPIAPRDSAAHFALASATYQGSPYEIVCEGIQSVGQALAQLTAYTMKGYEGRPDLLLMAVAESGVVNDYTNLLNFSDLAEACEYGLRSALPPLQRLGQHSVRLTTECRAALWPQRQSETVRWRKELRQRPIACAREHRLQRGGGCPGKHGEIDVLTGLVVLLTNELLHGGLRLPDQAVEMFPRHLKPLVISGVDRPSLKPAQCPVHAGIAGV